MKSYRSYLALLAAVFAFSIANVNAQGYSDTKSGRTIEQNVRRQILRMPRYEVFDHIAYKVDGTTVTLYGKVRNAINKSDAENRVEDIPGVVRVVNEIEILPLGNFDESIRRNLFYRLTRTGALSRYLSTVNPSVRLVVDRGHVTLEGYVANKSDSNLMNILANGISGVFSVTNNLKIDDDRAG